MSEVKKISAIVGQPVQITLQSMVGSTGYGWYLATLDGGLALSSAAIMPTSPGIAPVNHVFSFLSMKDGSYKVVFELLAPWRPGEPADTAIYEIDIQQPLKSAADDIAKAMDGKEFTNARMVNVGASPDTSTVLKYAAPMAAPSPTVLKYAAPMACPSTMMDYAAPMSYAGSMPADLASAGSPPQVIYAAPMAMSAAQSVAAMPQVIYAAPMAMCAAQSFAAMPQNMMAGNLPVVILYAAPMTQNVQPLYAAPMTQPGMLYAAPIVVRYAAPTAMNMSTMIQPYAAPFTGGGCC